MNKYVYKICPRLDWDHAQKNGVFEEFRINEDTKQISPFLADHDTWRFIFDISNYFVFI